VVVRVSSADYVPSKQATLESIDYLWRLLWPLSNDVVREHLLGVRRFVSHAHIGFQPGGVVPKNSRIWVENDEFKPRHNDGLED
jgi:hypothetical protein